MTDSVQIRWRRAKYRLPEQLGGGEIEATYNYAEAPGYEVSAMHQYETILQGGGAILRFNEPLEEIKPPSIDDPEPLPLNIRAMAGGLNVDVVLSTVYPDGAQLKIDDSDYVIHANLTPHGLRRLARAAWQRANAIEGGAS